MNTPHRTALALLLAGVLAVTGCSSDDDGEGAAENPTTTTTSPARVPTVEPSTLEGPITVGELSGPAEPRGTDLAAIDYVEEEFFASGEATSYTAEARPAANGRWTATPAETAPYKTRFVVRRPADADRFNGTVVVEWLNVSAVEASPEWSYASPAIIDAGAAWVGVSAQALGVVGGTAIIQTGSPEQAGGNGGIRASNPERYASLAHPGDAFAFDIYSQIGAALRDPGDVAVLGDAKARYVLAVGESQSAGYLTGYANGFQKEVNAFDGFLIHSRGSGGAHVDGTRAIRGATTPYRLRTDLDVPIMIFETETDVGPLLKYALARQPDTELLRTWEVAGTAHADQYLIEKSGFRPCPAPVNSGPQHYVVTAALDALMRWVEDGTAPARAERIETGGADGTTIVRDEMGIAVGGVRTPPVDAPVVVLSGDTQEGAPVLCALFGKTTPMGPEAIKDRFPTRQDYLDTFDESLAEAVQDGFVREADRDDFAAEARAFEFPD